MAVLRPRHRRAPTGFPPDALAGIVLLFLAVLPARAAPTTARISLAPNNAQPDWDCAQPALSADGRFVAFVSSATNLVPGQPLDVSDVYLADRQTGQVVCVSVSPAGERADGDSDSPALSADGRFVAFRSYATNLVLDDTNATEDVFLRDMRTGATLRVSSGPLGAQADAWSDSPAISADGRFVAFSSSATNLVPNDTNGARDIFLFDRDAGRTTRVSLAFDGAQTDGDSFAPSISADGRIIAFSSVATNIVLGDGNNASDVFTADRLTRAVARVSVASNGFEAQTDSDEPAVSPDGRYVAFRSWAADLASGDLNGVADVFLHDRASGATSRVSLGPAGLELDRSSGSPALSNEARYIAFVTRAAVTSADTNGWPDVFLRDRIAQTTSRVSLGASGGQADLWSDAPALTPDGAWLAFASYASDLVPGDTNAVSDVYVRGPLDAAFTLADAALALRLGAGLFEATTLQMARLNVVPGPGVDVSDATRLARRAVGLDP